MFAFPACAPIIVTLPAGPAETTIPHADTDNVSTLTGPLAEQDGTTATGGATKQTLMNNNSDDSAIATWDENSLDSILDKNANDSLYVLEFPFDGLDEEDISESLSGKLEADCSAGSIALTLLLGSSPTCWY